MVVATSSIEMGVRCDEGVTPPGHVEMGVWHDEEGVGSATGNPGVSQPVPVPVPMETRTRRHGYG